MLLHFKETYSYQTYYKVEKFALFLCKTSNA